MIFMLENNKKDNDKAHSRIFVGSWRLKESLRIIKKFLSSEFPEYALTGRLAKNIYARPEITKDIDFIVRLDERIADFINHIERKGYTIEPHEAGHWMYMLSVKGVRIDLVDPPTLRYGPPAISRRRIYRIPDVGDLYVLAPEDLTIYYLVSSLKPERELGDLDKAFNIVYFSLKRGDFDKEYFLKRSKGLGDQVYARALYVMRLIG